MVNIEGLISLIAIVYLAVAIILPVIRGMLKRLAEAERLETSMHPNEGNGGSISADSGASLAEAEEGLADAGEGAVSAESGGFIRDDGVIGRPTRDMGIGGDWTGEGVSSELAIDEEWTIDVFKDDTSTAGSWAEYAISTTEQPQAIPPGIVDLLCPAGIPSAVILGEILSPPRSKRAAPMGSGRQAFGVR